MPQDPYGRPGGSDFPFRDTTSAEHDQAVPEPSRSGRIAAVASATVLALGLGVAGYAIGVNSGGSTSAEQSSSIDTPEAARTAAEASATEAAARAAGDVDVLTGSGGWFSGSDEGFSSYSSFGFDGSSFNPYVSSIPVAGPDLSTQSPGTGEVTIYLAPETSAKAEVERVVALLGLEGGEVYGGDNLWAEYQGSNGIGISYSIGSISHLSYYDSSHWECTVYEGEILPDTAEATAAPDEAGATSEPEAAPGIEECEQGNSATQISDDEALALATEFLAELGVDTASYDWTVDNWGDATTSVHGESASAPGDYAYADVNSNGVSSAGIGTRGEEVSLGEYDLVSPAEATARLSDPRFQLIWVDVPSLWEDEDYYTMLDEVYTNAELPTAPVTPGSPIPAWVTEAVITDAELTQGLLYAVSGQEYQVPAYILTSTTGEKFTAVALSEDAFDFTP